MENFKMNSDHVEDNLLIHTPKDIKIGHIVQVERLVMQSYKKYCDDRYT